MATNFGDMLVSALKKTKSATPTGAAANNAGNGGRGLSAPGSVMAETRMGSQKGAAKMPPKRAGGATASTAPGEVQRATKLRKGST